ncbi:MAG: integrase, partial [Thaumarchaeota archaeon]|nr:integrase [Nitrososphaerota archaeon]
MKKYQDVLITSAMAKITILKQIKTLYYLTKFYGKDWDKFSKEDSVKLVSQIMQYYSRTGQETNTTFDFKKILKLFVRWINTGQRLKADNDLPDPESIR